MADRKKYRCCENCGGPFSYEIEIDENGACQKCLGYSVMAAEVFLIVETIGFSVHYEWMEKQVILGYFAIEGSAEEYVKSLLRERPPRELRIVKVWELYT